MGFEQAKNFVHSLGIRSCTEWKIYCKSGERPYNIPAFPPRTYCNIGWSGWKEWLGYECEKVKGDK